MVTIGNIQLPDKSLLLAPMEDVTDPSFRFICKHFGADMVYTEFIPSDGLIRDAKKSLKKLEIMDDERPIGIQLYGHLIDSMVEAAKIAEEAKPDLIDINFGCPVRKIANRGAGAGMLCNIPLMVEMTKAIVDAVRLPVTVKTRLGWDETTQKYRGHCRKASGCWHKRTHDPWANPGSAIQRQGRLDAYRPGKKQPAHEDPRDRQRRHCNDPVGC